MCDIYREASQSRIKLPGLGIKSGRIPKKWDIDHFALWGFGAVSQANRSWSTALHVYYKGVAWRNGSWSVPFLRGWVITHCVGFSQSAIPNGEKPLRLGTIRSNYPDQLPFGVIRIDPHHPRRKTPRGWRTRVSVGTRTAAVRVQRTTCSSKRCYMVPGRRRACLLLLPRRRARSATCATRLPLRQARSATCATRLPRCRGQSGRRTTRPRPQMCSSSIRAKCGKRWGVVS